MPFESVLQSWDSQISHSLAKDSVNEDISLFSAQVSILIPDISHALYLKHILYVSLALLQGFMLHTHLCTFFYKYNMFARVLLLLESSFGERRRMGFCAHFKRIREDCNIWDPRRFMFFLFYYCSLSALLLHAMLSLLSKNSHSERYVHT